MTLMQNNYDIRCSKPKSFPRTLFCICTNNEDIKVYKINGTFCILLYNLSFSCIANKLCKIAKIKIKKYKKNRQFDFALIFISIRSFIRRSEKHRRNNSRRPVMFIVDVICQYNEYHRCRQSRYLSTDASCHAICRRNDAFVRDTCRRHVLACKTIPVDKPRNGHPRYALLLPLSSLYFARCTRMIINSLIALVDPDSTLIRLLSVSEPFSWL